MSQLIEKQIQRIRETFQGNSEKPAKMPLEETILQEILECLISPYQCSKCGLRGDTPFCPDCDSEEFNKKCAHLCRHCGNIFTHNLSRCGAPELALCERCQGFENELMWERLRKEIGVKVEPEFYNFLANEKELNLKKLNCNEMTLEQLENHIFEIEKEIEKLKAISGGKRAARISKIQDDEEKGIKTDRDLFLVYSQD